MPTALSQSVVKNYLVNEIDQQDFELELGLF